MRGFGWKRAAFVMAFMIAVPLMTACPPGMFGGGGAVITVGGAANGHIVGPGHRIRYPLSISYPRTVSIYVDGHGLDPTVTLLNAAGGRIGYNDDGGSGLDSQLVVPLAPGSYIIEVAGYGSSTGPYTITVN